MFQFDSTTSKAVAGGLVTMLVGLLARYGFHIGPEYIDAIGVIVTGVISYLVGHAVVWLAPANKPKVL